MVIKKRTDSMETQNMLLDRKNILKFLVFKLICKFKVNNKIDEDTYQAPKKVLNYIWRNKETKI